MSLQHDVNFLYEMGRFRFVRRTWEHFFSGNLQNNAEHTFRVVWIAIFLAKLEGIESLGKISLIALLHDVSESRTGDVNYISRLYTKRMEQEAAKIFLVGFLLSKRC